MATRAHLNSPRVRIEPHLHRPREVLAHPAAELVHGVLEAVGDVVAGRPGRRTLVRRQTTGQTRGTLKH
jgi:hypothetical protein